MNKKYDFIALYFRCHLKVASCNSGEKKIRVVGRGDCDSGNGKKSKDRSQITTPTPLGKLGTLQSGVPTIGIPLLDDGKSQSSSSGRQSKRRNRKDKKRKNAERIGRRKEKSYQRVFKRLHS